jgi:hypothetical protein
VTVDPAAIVERLRAIEEDLRDLAYDRLRESVDTGQVLAEERRLHQARRAIEKAIRLLLPDGESTGDADD